MSWYRYRQNNSGGSHAYDASRGISVEVYVEADTADEANERAEQIGIYFDGVDDGFDCDCCGDRWYEASEYDALETDDAPPEPDEPMVRDDNAQSFQPMKWAGEGNYETFVHPKGEKFYGTHAELIHITRELTGYGLAFSTFEVGEVVGVGKDGWTEDGNGWYPAPEGRSFGMDQTILKIGGARLEIVEGFGSLGYRLWTSDRSVAEALRERVIEYHKSLPEFDPSAMLSGLVSEPKTVKG